MTKHLWMLCGFFLAFAFPATAPGQTITNQPQSIMINVASTATFTVGASSATSYQWQLNGAPLSDISNITGSAASMLTMEGVTTDEAGTYTVVVSNSVDSTSVTSSNAVLTLVPGTIARFIFTNVLGGTNFVDVQLFNYDKPVTVQNFLQYITAGAYTNMFFDRLLPEFVLQGGDYGTTDQTNTNSPLTGWSINQQFTMSDTIEPPFQSGIPNEFNVGPLIHNDFGTIAMALGSTQAGVVLTNSGSSAFFFNLTDNSGYPHYLDTTNNGPFVVFGRILDGSEVLSNFNELSDGSGIVTNGELFTDGFPSASIPNLPVNYMGTAAPANANLIYCTFQLMSPASATNPPAVLITSPISNAVLTNGFPVTVQGTATDNNNIGLALVRCDLIPVAAADGTLPNGGISMTNYILGATNWSTVFETVPPGVYELGAQAMDEASNLSPEVFQPLIVTAIVTNGNGTVTFTNGVFTNLNAVGYPFQDGTSYELLATPDTNQVFSNWSYEGNTVGIGPNLLLPMSDGLVLTVTFISNSLPNGLAFTYPLPNAIVTTNTFNITGTISSVPSPPVTITFYIFSTTVYSETATFSVTNNGATNWSFPVTDLPPDSYSVEAIAVDSASHTTVITENFTVQPSLTLNINGPGTVSGATNGEIIGLGTNFQVTAIPNPGQFFYAWSDGSVLSLNLVQTYTMSEGLTLTAIFLTNSVSNLIAFTYPQSNGIIGVGTFNLTGTISNAVSAAVTCQIFSQTGLTNVSPLLTTSGTTSWSVTVSNLGVGAYTAVAAGENLVGESTLISENFTVQYAANLQLIVVGSGSVSPVTNGQALPIGMPFQVTATPGSGEVFYTWNNGTQISSNAMQTYIMTSGLTLTATFIPAPTAIDGISFTYPAVNAKLNTNTFPLKGKIAPGFRPADITCQIFQTTGLAVGPPMTASGNTTWSMIASNIPGGDYTVEAVASDSAGMRTVVSENFSVLAFAAVEGTYSGVFICTNSPVSATNSGFLTFTVNPSGTFSGKLVFPAYAPVPIYSFAFQNLGFNTGATQFGLADFHGSPWTATLYLDLSGGSDSAGGTVSSTGWSSQLFCNRAVTKLSTNTTPAPGKYIFSLQSENQTNGPYTNGYVSLAVAKNGVMTLSGILPDDTSFSQSAKVSKDGLWPVYAVPAGDMNNGVLLGWETFTNSESSAGQLYWYKGRNAGAYYTEGVGLFSNMVLNATGTNFSRPTAGSQYSIVFQGGSLTAPVTNTLTVNDGGQFVVSGGPSDKLKISLSASGVIIGSVLNANNNMTLRFKGAFMGPSQGGSGFIPDAGGQTGSFQLALAPP